MKRLLCLAATAATTLACAQDALSLKGYSIGDAGAACPPDTVASQPMTRSGGIGCSLGATTFANRPARNLTVIIHDGRVIGVTVLLTDQGSRANGSVLAALIERYGEPTEQKAHLNEYHWRRAGAQLKLDGWKGYVMLSDISPAAAQRAKATATKNARDL